MPSPKHEQRENPLAFDPAQSAGLFVGVSTFEDRLIGTVPFAVDDAVDLAHFFVVEQGSLTAERTTLALAGEPQKARSRESLAKLRALGVRERPPTKSALYGALSEVRRESDGEGLLIVSVASHGLTDQGSDLVLPADARADRLVAMGLPLHDVFDEVARAGAPRRLVLIDTCRERLTEATRGLGGEPMSASFAAAIRNAKGQVVLSGTTHGGYSYDDLVRENGVFSAFVLDGLRGGAGADGDGWITAHTLAEFVQQRVSRWVKQHRPSHEAFHGIGQRIDGPGGEIRLVRHPEAAAARERYRESRKAAEERLKANLGGVLTGGLYDRVMAMLPEGGPGARSEELLEEIETLNGGQSAKRALRDLVEEIEGTRRPEEVRPPSPKPPEPPKPVRGTKEEPKESVRSWVGGWRRWAVLGLGGAAVAVALAIGIGLIVDWLRSRETGPKAAMEPPRTPVPKPPNPIAGTQLAGPLGMNFHLVPKGTYWIGSPDADKAWGEKDERRHGVKLTRGFWLGETEVTQGQWRKLVPLRNPSKFKSCGDDCPVEQVSWWEAVAFANLLSAQEHLELCYDVSSCTGELGTDGYQCGGVPFRGLSCTGYRLPTEAEWEVAARAVAAGRDNPDSIDGPNLGDLAWFFDNSGGVTHRVGTRQPNAWGFADILGNVYEWTADAYADYPGQDLVRDPLGESGTSRVIRGGSWDSGARDVRAAFRAGAPPSRRWRNLGFRLARGQAAPG